MPYMAILFQNTRQATTTAAFWNVLKNRQCLSANYKQDNENENCHLNEAASYTNPESIKVTWGWWYYEMVRSYLKKVTLFSL